MPNYVVDGRNYFFSEEIGQEEAERQIRLIHGTVGADSSDYNNPKDEGTLQEIAEGVVSGAIAIPQGVIETGTSLFDLAFVSLHFIINFSSLRQFSTYSFISAIIFSPLLLF